MEADTVSLWKFTMLDPDDTTPEFEPTLLLVLVAQEIADSDCAPDVLRLPLKLIEHEANAAEQARLRIIFFNIK